MFINFQKIRNIILQAAIRFPLAFICCIAFYAIASGIIKMDNASIEVVLPVLFIGCFIAIAFKLVAERYAYNGHLHEAIPLASALIVWLLNRGQDFGPQMILLCMASFLSPFILPFIAKKSEDSQYFRFGTEFLSKIIYVTLTSVIIYMAVSAIFTTLDYLFKIEFKSVFFSSFIFIAALFAPVMALGSIPTRFDVMIEHKERDFKNALCSILIVLLLCYAVILYAYMTKILFGELPKGDVVYLVLAFGFVGSAIYQLVLTIQRQAGSIFDFYQLHFYKILILPLVLLLIAISRRISDYGLTDKRYLVMIGFLWLVSAIIISFSQRKNKVILMMTAAFALMVFFAVGPWSVNNLPVFLQKKKAETLLAKEMDFKDQDKLVSALTYLAEHDRSQHPWIRNVVRQHLEGNVSSYNHEPRWRYDSLRRTLNITEDAKAKVSQFFIEATDPASEAILVSGYDYMIVMQGESNFNLPVSIKLTSPEAGERTVTVEGVKNKPLLKISDNEIDRHVTVDLEALIRDNGYIASVKPNRLFVSGIGKGMRAYVWVKKMTGDASLDGRKVNLSSISGYLLIKYTE